MVIDDLDPIGTAIVPNETDAPLVVDPDTMLTRPVAAQRLQSIARRGGQVTQFVRLMKLPQLPLRRTLDVPRQPPRKAAMEQSLGISVGKRTNHSPICIYASRS
jgi:hypothetical protein